MTPKPPKGPATPAQTLDAPPLPMTATPKQRDDLAAVSRMLRADQTGGDDEEVDEGVDDDEEDPEPEALKGTAAPPTVTEPSPPVAEGFGAPEWFRMPPEGLPSDVEPGSQVAFVRFPVWITGRPAKGERQCALRPLSLALERFARQKSKGDKTGYETTAELAKMTICAVDGRLPELFKAGPGSVNHFWAEIGPKARQAVITYYIQTHQFTEKERDSFLGSCLTVRTVG